MAASVGVLSTSSLAVMALRHDDPVSYVSARIESEEVGLVQGVDALEEIFRSKGLLYEVGFDPANRGGLGGNHSEVHLLASEIAFVGWSWPQTNHATCVEVKPGDKTVENFNRKLCSGVPLAPVAPDSILFGSLSCGHTNMILRAIAFGAPSNDALLSEGGKFCLTKVLKRDPDFGRAVQTGLHWKVLSWKVRDLCPKALEWFQAARNVASRMERSESEVSGLAKLHALAVSMEKEAMLKGLTKVTIDWGLIKKIMLRSRPAYASSLDSLIAFVAARSGGSDGKYLKYLMGFHSFFVTASVKQRLPVQLYQALADFKYHFLALAFFELAYCCPETNVIFGTCNWLSASSVNALNKNKDLIPQLVEADSFLKGIRNCLAASGFVGDIEGDNNMLKVIVTVDLWTVQMLLGKFVTKDHQHTCIGQVASAFAALFKESFPTLDFAAFREVMPELMVPVPVAAQPAASKSSGAVELYAFDASGELIDGRALLRQGGWELHAVVAKGVNPKYFRIASIETNMASACSDDSGEAMVLLEGLGLNKGEKLLMTVSDFLLHSKEGDCVLAKESDVPEKHPGWPSLRVGIKHDAKELRAKAMVHLALGATLELAGPKMNVDDRLRVLVKPNRKVVATTDFAVGELLLMPETMNVKLASREAEAVCGYAATGVLEALVEQKVSEGVFKDFLPGTLLHLTPSTADDGMAALWFVGTTPDMDKANVCFEWFEVQMLHGIDWAGSTPLAPAVVSRRRMNSKTTHAEEQNVLEFKVSVPVLVNSEPLVMGSELLLYRPPPAPRKREVEAIVVSKLVKQRMS